MIPVGSTLIRLGEFKNKTIRIYRKGSKVYISEGKKHRESVSDSWELSNLPERLKAFVLNELYSRETVIALNIHKPFWSR